MHFNSRPREEVDNTRCIVDQCFSHFNSRPREEVDNTPAPNRQTPQNFNSRPREEVDKNLQKAFQEVSISTHDLAKRSTTLRGALYPSDQHFNSRPREEVDVKMQMANNTSGIFQLTTSRRGRPAGSSSTL